MAITSVIMATSCVAVVTAADVRANCGQEGGDGLKLKNCTACLLVKYCCVDCQEAHRKQHKKACKKRAAELKDEKLYGQGQERPEADFCPICLLAIPFPVEDHAELRECCIKLVCNGCSLAASKQGFGAACPFCRTPDSKNDEEALAMIQKRVAARDPEAMVHLGDVHINGVYGLEKNESRAFELWTEAAELGSLRALFKMGIAYYDGLRGISLDRAKGVHCLESAAMGGDASSRHKLGVF